MDKGSSEDCSDEDSMHSSAYDFDGGSEEDLIYASDDPEFDRDTNIVTGASRLRMPWRYIPSYERLPLRHGEIRLLHLLPGTAGDTIRCKLTKASIHDTTFDALSYTWGDQRDTRTIDVDGWVARVTTNLHTALEYLRHSDREFIFWIDALCINQDDLEERSAQVQSMHEVYGAAYEVIVWLGKPTSRTDLAIDAWNSPGPFAFDESVCLGVVELAQRPWWTRVWAIQEIAMASRARLACGSKTVDWQSVMNTYTAGPPAVRTWDLPSAWAIASDHVLRLDRLKRQFGRLGAHKTR